ncbi:hypothetical protein [Roseobacter sp. N2S]|uniref:hypothetical protein n=1 Tax=Roseobacter sp. N2S TaxID=2663844 RepID=UPI00285776AB|nr:hypothetical protein [Roseobacter sp. N2S]MDR6266437.1 hypothetical protein [Roseobacter sp. N2S]
MSATIPMWATGPAEILQQALNLMEENTDASRRIAMILVDNAVELTLHTYLTLPERVTAVKLTRRQRDEYCNSFPNLLEGIEAVASSKVVGLNLGEFEWFHRLRNRLYHEGNGLTIEKRKVEVYAELSLTLFKALFDCELELLTSENSSAALVGEFFADWISVERNIIEAAGGGERIPLSQAVAILRKRGELTEADYLALKQVQTIRNELVHGEAEPEEMLRPSNMSKVKSLALSVGEVLAGMRVGVP